MTTPKTTTKVLTEALRVLAMDIQSEDGVANAAIAEAAGRLEELQAENKALREALEWALAQLDYEDGLLMAHKAHVFYHEVAGYAKAKAALTAKREEGGR